MKESSSKRNSINMLEDAVPDNTVVKQVTPYSEGEAPNSNNESKHNGGVSNVLLEGNHDISSASDGSSSSSGGEGGGEEVESKVESSNNVKPMGVNTTDDKEVAAAAEVMKSNSRRPSGFRSLGKSLFKRVSSRKSTHFAETVVKVEAETFADIDSLEANETDEGGGGGGGGSETNGAVGEGEDGSTAQDRPRALTVKESVDPFTMFSANM
jgi:hypothetical protein